jgi:predicted transposase YbfD/YdcC
MRIIEYFEGVETTRQYQGYFHSVGQALTLLILGSLCGLRNVSQIHQWAGSERISAFLKGRFGIADIPSYYWLLCLLKIVDPASLNLCFVRWAQSLLPESAKGLTLSCDGKTIRSTGRMDSHASAMHIVSAHVGELGLTLGQRAADGKGNEIPAVRELLDLLEVAGCMVVADALNCQRETASAIIAKKADYLPGVKDNQETLKKDIEDYVKDASLRKAMDTAETLEKNRGRIERRTAFATSDVGWLRGGVAWAGLSCIGAIHTRFETKKKVTDEWHYYISSRELTAKDLLRHARLEWGVESMHWLLDVHFAEDFCRAEDANIQQNLNIVRKIALNAIRDYKNRHGSERAFSKIMLDCLLDTDILMDVLLHRGGGAKGAG